MISDILQHEKSHYGIDWEAVANGNEKETSGAVSKAHERLHEIRKKMSDKEVEGAKAMGLLTSNGVQQILKVLQILEMNRENIMPSKYPYLQCLFLSCCESFANIL